MNTSIAKHRLLREVLRNYVSLKAEQIDDWDYEICQIPGCINGFEGRAVKGHPGECDLIALNLMDLKNCLNKLSKRKKEAIFYNVILDMKQKDVAEVMGITTVSVGQYVEQGMIQVAEWIWPD